MTETLLPYRAWLKPGERWTPANGTEGMLFMEAYCAECVHDDFSRDEDGESCEVIMRSLAGEDTPEWVMGEDGMVTCTKLRHVDDGPLPEINPDQMTLGGE